MHCRQMQRRIARMVALLTPTAPPVCLRIRPRAQEAHVAWAGRGRLGSGHKFEPPCSSRSISECTKLHGTASEASSGQYSNCGTVTLAVLNAPMDCSRRERRPPLAVALRRKGCACMGQPTSVRRCAYEQHCRPYRFTAIFLRGCWHSLAGAMCKGTAGCGSLRRTHWSAPEAAAARPSGSPSCTRDGERWCHLHRKATASHSML
jgi:hypothetical protein